MIASNGLAQRELALAGVGPALMPTWLSGSQIASRQLVDIVPEYTITLGDFDGVAWRGCFIPAEPSCPRRRAPSWTSY
jgi:DNA-binding transcriptional LysR family regulator